MKKIVIGFVLVVLMIGCASANMVSSSDKEYRYSEYTSKYADIDNGAINPDIYGYVVFRIKGTSVQDNTIWYQNVKQGLKFDYTYHPDKTAIEGQNPGFEKVKLLTDGSMPVVIAYLLPQCKSEITKYDFSIYFTPEIAPIVNFPMVSSCNLNWHNFAGYGQSNWLQKTALNFLPPS